MIVEVLCEDRSSVPVLDHILKQISQDRKFIKQIQIFPHRGKGKLPDDIEEKPKAFSSSLLDLLPAKVRAYDKVYQDEEIILVVVLDSDFQNPSDLYRSIEYVFRNGSPNKYFVIGICVEEMEAWLLGDEQALLSAYPNADLDVIHAYQQDSLGGTWQILARAILHQRAEDLIDVGYPAVGIYKARWAENIAPYLRVENNKSPSFHEFINRFVQVLDWAKEKYIDVTND